MSLRVRLVLWLGGVLAVTLGLGCAVAGWRAQASVRAEMQSALAAGRQSAANSIAEIIGSQGQLRELRHLVTTFDGNRHVQATLTDDRDAVIAASFLQRPGEPVPAWFRRLIDPALPAAVLAVPSSPGWETGGTLTLATDAANEIDEVWDQATDTLCLLAVFFGLTVLLIHWTVGRALAPLARLSAAFGRIGAGDYTARLEAAGPPELARLAGGFNRMAEQLGQAEAQNAMLREQVLSLQEEERAELARDLHDDIGPLLFAAGIDAASIPALLADGQPAEAADRADAIQDAIASMQRHIRAILGRLRPLSFGAVDLEDAIGNIIAFWRIRHPAVAFTLDVASEDEALDEAVRTTVCRVVQESVCNAIRHGTPTQIAVSVRRDGPDIVVQVDDDGGGPGTAGLTPGFGLVGMQERVRAQAGSLAVAPSAGGRGLAVTARLPCEMPA
ncbi:MAG: HAMP domain-containing protein [Rhodopila sp.]